MSVTATLAQYAAVTSWISDEELIAASPAARKADDRLYWARERYTLCRDLLGYAPGCRQYREDLAEAAAELEEAQAAREKALDRAWARFQRTREALAAAAVPAAA
jgi:hypothetical protein